MNFLAPQFLFGLLAISIPIIIHLFNFRKAKKVFFSSNRYLRKVNEETSSKRNLKHLLILLSRIGFVVFLVLAFARPFIPAEEKELQSYVQIYLDNSFSMSNEFDEDISGLDRAIGIVDNLVDQYPTGTRFRLVTNDFLPFSNIFRSGEEIKEILTELDYSKITREAQQIRERLRTDDIADDLVDNYWISDFQESIYNSLVEDSLNLRVVAIPFTTTGNIFIDSMYTETPFLQSGERLKLYARLVNRGDREVENLNLKVFINDIQVTTNSLTIPPRGMEMAVFDLAFSLEKSNRGRISFEDFPVTFDNEFYFILNKPEKIKVIEIKGSGASNRVGQVFGNQDLFEFRSYPLANLDYSAVNSANLVILNELDQLDNSLRILLVNYLSSYGNLAIFPSTQANPTSFSELVNVPIIKLDSSENIALSSPDFSNPFFADVFEDKNQNMKMPTAKRLWQWFNDRDAIIRYANGTPFLSKINRMGNVYMFSSPLTNQYTDFPIHALFVPVMYKIATSGLSGSENLYITLSDGQFTIPMDSIPDNALLKMRSGESELIPQQRFMGNNVLIDLPPTEINNGFYDLLLENEVIRQIAFNSDKRESVLLQLEGSEIAQLFEGSEIEVLREIGDDNDAKVLYAQYQPTPLWKYAIMISILFLVAEVMLFKLLP